jgi:vacuolar-type H+-ATPase subunit E/Vma4
VSLDAILDAIEASGAAEVARQQAETEARAQQILDEAAAEAAARREATRRAARWPAFGIRSRKMHHAQLEALHAASAARDQLIDETLAEVRARLADIRADPGYPDILRRLIREAAAVLGDEAAESSSPRLEVDPRDELLVRPVLDALGLQAEVRLSLRSWGGVIARSGCDRITATNTLEARLERAVPFLRSDLAAFFDQAAREELLAQPAVSVPGCEPARVPA